jgi:hypothetical protein
LVLNLSYFLERSFIMANKTIIELNPVTPSSTAAIPVYENGSTGRASASQILRT